MHVPVSTWRPALELEPQADEPLYLQIARAVSAEIERGCLRPGTRLPGTRRLAKTLGVHRNTAVSAYAELAGARLRLRAFIGLPDGSRVIAGERAGPAAEPEALGAALGEELKARGAGAILAEVEKQAAGGR